MARKIEPAQVTLASDGFYPRAFRWSGRSIRVLFVERMRATGAERWFRVRTVEGMYELIQDAGAQTWTLARRPSWWERAVGQGADAARYEPTGRGRIGRAQARARAQQRQRLSRAQSAGEGGGHASGVVVVR